MGDLFSRLSKSQWMAVGLLLFILLLFGLLVLAPVLQARAEYVATAEDLIFRLERLHRLVAQKDKWVGQLEQARRQNQQEQRFLSRDTPALASADLQTQIRTIVKEGGGELTSTQALPEEKEERFYRIAVKVRLTGSTHMLRDMFYRIESANPSLFVKNLNIRPIRINQSLGSDKYLNVDKLSIDFDVVGYMRAPAS